MADPNTKDNVVKERIINHMNNDHHDSIVRYLEHYHKLSPWQAFDARMSGVDLKGMTFVRGKQTYRISFDPPMQTLSDARERVVAIDKQCLAALGKSDITIKEFVPPTGLYLIEFFVILATFLVYGERWWFAPGSLGERLLGAGFARFNYSIQPHLSKPMGLIHCVEVVYFMKYKLLKHSVNPRTKIFWQWVLTILIEGQFAFYRFNVLVARQREAKTKQKH